MKEDRLDCCVVRDLLPGYIEELTEPETARQVRAHLEHCPDCRQREADMRRALPIEKAPRRALGFLKRVRRTRLVAAALSAALALACMGWLYDTAYHYPNTEAGRLAARCPGYGQGRGPGHPSGGGGLAGTGKVSVPLLYGGQ